MQASTSGEDSMKNPKIGLLPFYIKLYDDINPALRKPLEAWMDQISAELRKLGLDLSAAGVCRLEPEFEKAVADFEAAGVDAIVTLHLSYSPSLESVNPLAATKLPLIVLDTTPDFDFSPATSTPALIMNNHGIHGVQDFCNLLLRRGKSFRIEAGHWRESDVLKRVADHARGTRMASAMRSARVGIIGEAFKGMGDFSVPDEDLKEELGVTVVRIDPSEVAGNLPAESDSAVKAEIESDRKRFTVKGAFDRAHLDSVRTGLALRKIAQKEALTALTLCFLEVRKEQGIPVMPFLEISKAMERGIGYGGEGDTLTAALVAALLSVYPDSTFTEMFCPDWKTGHVFLSHMGEMNLLAAEKTPVLFEKKWTFSPADNPAVAAAAFKPGKAVFVNLAPAPDGFNLILAPVEIVSEGENATFEECIRGWFKPAMPLSRFLEEYSKAGGTHHAAMVYGDALGALRSFGAAMEMNVITLG